MRILHIFDHSLPLQSGYVSRSLGIIRGQRSRGWETFHLTSPRYHSSSSTPEIVDGLSFYRSGEVNTSVPILRELLEMKATRRALCEAIRAVKPDILHAHSPVLNVLPAISVSRKFGLPLVYEVRALWEDAAIDLGHTKPKSLRYRISRALETYAMSRVSKVVTLSESLREEIVARKIPSDHVTVVPNAVDSSLLGEIITSQSSLREQLGIGEHPVFGFIGSFYAYEGLDLLLEAVPILQRQMPHFTILLVGGGPEEGRLRKMVEDAGISHLVKFTGRVHHQEVARYYGLIDVCVFPRRQMRLTDLVTPLKPLEAMARMRPVVASDVGGHRELITDGETGYLFPAGDVNALAELLRMVISNPVGASKIAKRGRAHVEANRNWDIVANKYGAIYEGLLTKGTKKLRASRKTK